MIVSTLNKYIVLNFDGIVVFVLPVFMGTLFGYIVYLRLNSLKDSQIQSFEGLVKIIELKDKYTVGHSQRVADLSVQIAKAYGKNIDLDLIYTAGYLHDIGKIGISENILNKEGKLTEIEYSQVKKHCYDGYNILKPFKYFDEVKNIIKSHHERIDGGGYPEGLVGKDIPLESKILAIADVYDALISDRPYRKGLTRKEALIIMEKVAGKQLDKEYF